MRWVIADILAKLMDCPVCSSSLDDPQPGTYTKTCPTGCGHFTVTAIEPDGTVDVTFKMSPALARP